MHRALLLVLVMATAPPWSRRKRRSSERDGESLPDIELRVEFGSSQADDHDDEFYIEFDDDDPAVRSHFDRNETIEAAKQKGRFDQALAAARTDIDHAAEFLHAWNRDMAENAARVGEPAPEWQTVRFPAVEAICQIGVARRDTDLLRHAHTVLAAIPGLEHHTDELAQALDDAAACNRLIGLLSTQPGTRQAGLSKRIDHNGHRLRSIIHWLERDGQLVKIRDGKSWRLYLPADAPEAPPPPPTDAVAATTSNRTTTPAATPAPAPAPTGPPPAVRLVTIDVETATADYGSICALAATWVDNGQLIGTRHWLVQPPGNRYDPTNIRIHGIEPHHTADAPTFDTLWDWLIPHLDGFPLAAHNAPFDRTAIQRSLQAAGRTPPALDIACTVQASRKVWPSLPDHKLPTVSAHVGHPVTRHHDAAADAEAAAHIAVSICAAAQITDLRQL